MGLVDLVENGVDSLVNSVSNRNFWLKSGLVELYNKKEDSIDNVNQLLIYHNVYNYRFYREDLSRYGEINNDVYVVKNVKYLNKSYVKNFMYNVQRDYVDLTTSNKELNLYHKAFNNLPMLSNYNSFITCFEVNSLDISEIVKAFGKVLVISNNEEDLYQIISNYMDFSMAGKSYVKGHLRNLILKNKDWLQKVNKILVQGDLNALTNEDFTKIDKLDADLNEIVKGYRHEITGF